MNTSLDQHISQSIYLEAFLAIHMPWITLKLQVLNTFAVPYYFMHHSFSRQGLCYLQTHAFLQAKDKDSDIHKACTNASWHKVGSKHSGTHRSLVTHSHFLG